MADTVDLKSTAPSWAWGFESPSEYFAQMDGMADTVDSKSAARKGVGVRVPL